MLSVAFNQPQVVSADGVWIFFMVLVIDFCLLNKVR